MLLFRIGPFYEPSVSLVTGHNQLSACVIALMHSRVNVCVWTVSSCDDGSGVRERGGNKPSMFQSPDNNIMLNPTHIIILKCIIP